MHHQFFVVFLALGISMGCSPSPNDSADSDISQETLSETSSVSSTQDEEAIRSIMDRQENCWNEGNIDCFMVGYWPSDSLMYISSSGITYGYENARERYRRSYPDRANMGTLQFQIVTLDRLAPDAYHMVGQWALEREVGNIGGHFTLVFRNIDGEWVIVSDHSSQSSS